MTSPADRVRGVFAQLHQEGGDRLARAHLCQPFALWCLEAIRAQPERSLRYAALDGVMAALDDAGIDGIIDGSS